MNGSTCTGPYAMHILSGVKHLENRNAMPMQPWDVTTGRRDCSEGCDMIDFVRR